MARTFLEYCRRPDSADFDMTRNHLEENLWWESARDVVGSLDLRACPAAWSLIVRISDFWNHEDLRESPLAIYVSACPDLMKILACGHYKRLFEYYDVGFFEYRKLYPRKWKKMILAPRRSSVEHDLMSLWQSATVDSDKAIPLSRCESPEDVSRMLKRARRELEITPMVGHYVKGTSVDVLTKARRHGLRIEEVAESIAAGVPEEDIFA